MPKVGEVLRHSLFGHEGVVTQVNAHDFWVQWSGGSRPWLYKELDFGSYLKPVWQPDDWADELVVRL